MLWRLFGPELRPRFEGDQINPVTTTGRTVMVGRREMFVREAGPSDASPLVLIHGWGDPSNVIYVRLLPILAKRFRVVAIDNRGAGKSDHGRADYTIEDAADDIAGVMSALGIDDAAVFGYSMGGMIAQALAYRHPTRVSRLGLGGTAARVEHLGQASSVVARPALLLARAIERFGRSEVSYLRLRYLLSVGAIQPSEAEHFWVQSVNRDPEEYWLAGFAAAAFDARSWVGSLDLPVLVFVNTSDQLVPPSAQRKLGDLIPGAKVIELHGARHEAPLNQHVQMGAFLETFMSGS